MTATCNHICALTAEYSPKMIGLKVMQVPATAARTREDMRMYRRRLPSYRWNIFVRSLDLPAAAAISGISKAAAISRG